MIETDAFLMSLCIFAPTLFAMVVLFFPKGSEEYMRWWTLLGTTVALVLSIVLFIDYHFMLDPPALGDAKDSEYHAKVAKTTLGYRAALATAQARADKPRSSDDVLSRNSWIPRFNIDYFLGVDGISVALVLLTTLLFFVSMIASWTISRYVKGYCALFLLLETGVIGTFLALDFFLFYIFWEVMLLPMYFLIGVWGGPRREYAAIKFFLYTLLGSVFILIAMLAFYFTDVRDFVNPTQASTSSRNNRIEGATDTGVHSFDLMVLTRVGRTALEVLDYQESDPPDPAKKTAHLKKVAEKVLRETQWQAQSQENRTLLAMSKEMLKKGDEAKRKDIQDTMDSVIQRELPGAVQRLQKQAFFTKTFQWTMFLLLFAGFAIKVPVFPFHTWLPDAHVEAPTPISMILAGILLKLGGYGILRIAYPICPWAAFDLANFLALIGMVNIVYGAFAAMAQTDFKKLVAYSSISHMGYVILGIAVWSTTGSVYWSWGMNGAMYQMIGHGISSAGMFFLVGVIYDRAHHRNLDNFRGLYEPMPLYGGISAIIFFAALGLPGLCGFVGEFMVVLATWNYSPVYAVLAALTVVITAAYILWTLQRVYFGTNPAYKDYQDMSLREIACAVPLVLFAVLLGIFPRLVLDWVEPHLTALVDSLVLR